MMIKEEERYTARGRTSVLLDPCDGKEKRGVRCLLLTLIFSILFLLVALIAVSVVVFQHFGSINEVNAYYPYSSSPSERTTKKLRPERKTDYSTTRALKALNSMAASEDLNAGCETTLIISRHCNDLGDDKWKDATGNKHCSYQGYEQSHYFATLFGDDSSTAKWPTPTHLFALMFPQAEGYNYRQWETLRPLSNQTGVPIQNVWNYDFYAKYIKILKSGALCGKLSIAVMKHLYIPELGFLFGCGEPQGCPAVYPEMEFDRMLQLKFVYGQPSGVDTYINEETVLFNGNSTDYRENNKDAWNVYGAIASQNFDPLAFSKQAGDYTKSGTSRGGRWQT